MSLTTTDNKRRFFDKQEQWLLFSQHAHYIVHEGIHLQHSFRKIYEQLAALRRDAARAAGSKHAEKYGF